MTSDSGAGGPPDLAAALTEVAGIAATPGTLAERAGALLRPLLRVVRFDAAWIALLPPDHDVHVAVVRTGYDDRICDFMDSPALLPEAERVGLLGTRRAMRACDFPFPPSELVGWAEYLEPAGFRDAGTVGLFTADGRYLGFLAVHTAEADEVSEAARDALGVLAAPIAAAVDPWRCLATIAGLVHGATAGVVLARSGAVLPLPGLPDHPLLTLDSAVLAVAPAQLAEGGPHTSFLAPLGAPDGGDTHVRITVLSVPLDVRVFATAVVLVSPAGDLHGLSHRELQVLGHLVTGASNERIAAALGIAPRTVEVHVDHVRAKLGAPSRTTAAARALRTGLFVPVALVSRPGRRTAPAAVRRA